MNHDLVKRFIGKKCMISTGAFGSGLTSVIGIVKQVQETWLELEDKKGKIALVNLDFIVSIKEA